MFDLAEESWRDQGREGKLQLVVCLYYALGPKADRRGDYIRHSYSFLLLFWNGAHLGERIFGQPLDVAFYLLLASA